MLKSSLLEIIRTFSKEELKSFEDFVSSPYFNKKENLIKLFLEIKKCSPDFTHENLEKEVVWKKLFPGKEYNYGIMKNLIHELTKLTETYIRLEFIDKNELRKEYELLEALFDRNVLKLLSNKFIKFEKIYTDGHLKTLGSEIQESYYNLSNAYWLKFYSDYLFDTNSNYENSKSLACDYLIFSFLIYAFKAHNNNNIRNVSKHFNRGKNIIELFFDNIGTHGLEEIVNYAKTKSRVSHTILSCFFLMYRSLSENNVENYIKFKEALAEHGYIFSYQDLRDLYACLGTSFGKLNSPDIKTAQEYFDMYHSMIRQGIFLEPNGCLSEHSFNRYVDRCCELGKHSEIEKFMAVYLDKLPKDLRANSENYALACLSFSKSEFEKSIEYLSKTNDNYFELKYSLQNLRLKIYYELNDLESFLFLMDSSKHFISKNPSVDQKTKATDSVFYNTINKLFKLKDFFDEYEFNKLKQEVLSTDSSYNTWLLRKFDEIEALKKT